ncbi:MAG: ABC transporter permease subunit [bacterium]
MVINIYKYEVRRIFKSAIFWTFIICLLIVVDMVFFREMINSGMVDQLMDFMESPFIGDMMKGFGVKPDTMTDVLGFYALRNTMITMTMGALFAVIASSSLISLEEYEKTAEFLFSRPVTRFDIMTGKLLAFHTNLFFLNFVSSIVGFISLEVFKNSEYNIYSYIILCIYTYLLTLLFGSIGLFFSLLVKRGRVFIGAVIGIVLGTYFLEIISNVTESANFIGYFSPFKYADKDVLREGYNLEFWNSIFFFGGILLFTIFSYRIFQKKDIIL